MYQITVVQPHFLGCANSHTFSLILNNAAGFRVMSMLWTKMVGLAIYLVRDRRD